MAAQIIFGSAFEGSTATLLARITGEDGTPITAASVTAIAYEAWQIPIPPEYKIGRDWKSLYVDTQTPVKIVAAEDDPLDPVDVIFDTLQTDARWTKDAIGYNFAHVLPDDTFEEIAKNLYPKGQWYELPFEVQPFGDQPAFFFAYKCLAKHILFGKT